VIGGLAERCYGPLPSAEWRNGRRDGFKIRYQKWCTGSTPVSATKWCEEERFLVTGSLFFVAPLRAAGPPHCQSTAPRASVIASERGRGRPPTPPSQPAVVSARPTTKHAQSDTLSSRNHRVNTIAQQLRRWLGSSGRALRPRRLATTVWLGAFLSACGTAGTSVGSNAHEHGRSTSGILPTRVLTACEQRLYPDRELDEDTIGACVLGISARFLQRCGGSVDWTVFESGIVTIRRLEGYDRTELRRIDPVVLEQKLARLRSIVESLASVSFAGDDMEGCFPVTGLTMRTPTAVLSRRMEDDADREVLTELQSLVDASEPIGCADVPPDCDSLVEDARRDYRTHLGVDSGRSLADLTPDEWRSACMSIREVWGSSEFCECPSCGVPPTTCLASAGAIEACLASMLASPSRTSAEEIRQLVQPLPECSWLSDAACTRLLP
jgi:hypothetical protein